MTTSHDLLTMLDRVAGQIEQAGDAELARMVRGYVRDCRDGFENGHDLISRIGVLSLQRKDGTSVPLSNLKAHIRRGTAPASGSSLLAMIEAARSRIAALGREARNLGPGGNRMRRELAEINRLVRAGDAPARRPDQPVHVDPDGLQQREDHWGA